MLKNIAIRLDMKEICLDQEKKDMKNLEWTPLRDEEFSKKSFEVYRDSMTSIVAYLQRSPLMQSEEELIKLIDRAFIGMVSSIERYGKLYSVVNDIHELKLGKLNTEIEKLQTELQEVKSKLIDEQAMFTEENKQALEKRVWDFLGKGQMRIRDQNGPGETVSKLKEQLLFILEESQYSGA